jgi:hypothetical protein
MQRAAKRATVRAFRRSESGGMRPSRLKPIILRPIALLGSLLVAGAIDAVSGHHVARAAEDERLSVAIDGGLVSLDAHDAPLADVLRAIGEQAGIVVSVQGGAGPRISRSLSGKPLSEALELLLGEAASGVIYKRASGRLAELRVRLMSVQAAAHAASTPSVARSEPGALAEDRAIAPDAPREDRLAFVRETARAPRADALDVLSALLLEDDAPLVRRSAAAALGRLRDEAAGEALSAALADRDRHVRRLAARGLGEHGGELAIGALGRVLIEERVPTVRRMAAWALSRMGHEAALAALDMARLDLDPTVRKIAEAALTQD